MSKKVFVHGRAGKGIKNKEFDHEEKFPKDRQMVEFGGFNFVVKDSTQHFFSSDEVITLIGPELISHLAKAFDIPKKKYPSTGEKYFKGKQIRFPTPRPDVSFFEGGKLEIEIIFHYKGKTEKKK